MGFIQSSREVSENDELGSVAISLVRQFESAVDFSIQVTSGMYIHMNQCRMTTP